MNVPVHVHLHIVMDMKTEMLTLHPACTVEKQTLKKNFTYLSNYYNDSQKSAPGKALSSLFIMFM